MVTGSRDLPGFARDLYGRPGVAEQLLALQDQRGLDVLLLLAAAWVAQLDLSLSEAAWRELAGNHEAVGRGVIAPLRAARRAAREQPQLAPAYQRLKDVELEIEFSQLRILGAHCLALGQPPGEVLGQALRSCCRAQGLALNDDLEQALERLCVVMRGEGTPG